MNFYAKLPRSQRPILYDVGHVVSIHGKPAIGGPFSKVEKVVSKGSHYWTCVGADKNPRVFDGHKWSDLPHDKSYRYKKGE